MNADNQQTIPVRQNYGRRGLPVELVERMYADYLRLKSLRKTAAMHGKSNQALQECFRRHGLKTPRKLHQPVLYKGKKYTPSRDGALRRTDGREKMHRGCLLHHIVWEENFGPIPAGHQVTFKNGDKTDVRPENLICLIRAEMSRRNATGENGATKAKAARLIEEHMGFIVHEAQRYSGLYGVQVEDLIQEGRLAVASASRTFDAKQGFKFLSYAGKGIKGAMGRFARRHRHVIRVPESKFKEVTIHQVSTDAPIGEDGDQTFGEVFLSVDESVTEDINCSETAERLQRALKRLPKKMRGVIQARFFEQKTLEEVGDRFGLTKERIRQIEVLALRKLRRSRILKEVAA